jgi:hypothetical protein
MSTPDPDHLLDQAERLVASTGGGRARLIDLRRAVSNAYYALFHVAVTAAVDAVVGRTHRKTTRYGLAYRTVEHGALRRLCEDAAKSPLPSRYTKVVPGSGFGADLQFFAGMLVALQDQRHLADYDPLFGTTRSETLVLVHRSREALMRFRAAEKALRDAFLTLVIFPPRQTQRTPET